MADKLDINALMAAQGGQTPQAQPRVDRIDPQALLAATAPSAEPTAQHEPSFLERLGGWKGLAATGIRGGAGILAGEGGPIGAAIGAGGETAAQAMEQGTFNPNVNLKRVGVEAALSAVPFGKIVKGGHALMSGIRSGAMGAVGEGGRELSEGHDLDPTAIATQGGLAGLLGLIGGRFSKGHGPTGPGEPPAPPPVPREEAGTRVWPAPPGVSSRSTGPQPSPRQQFDFVQSIRGGVDKAINKAPNAMDYLDDLDSAISATGKEARATRAANFRMETTAGRAENAADIQALRGELAEQGRVTKAADKATTQAPINDTKEIQRDQKNLLDVLKWRGQQDANKVAQAAIDDGKIGLEAKPPTIRETSTVKGPANNQSITQTWGKPSEEGAIGARAAEQEAERAAAQGDMNARRAAEQRANYRPSEGDPLSGITDEVMRDEAARGVPNNPVAQGLEAERQAAEEAFRASQGAVTPEVAEPETALAKFFKSKQGAAGANYGAAKDAEKAGEIASSKGARDGLLIEQGKQPEGPLAGLRSAMGEETGAVPPRTGDAGASLSPEAPDWVRQQSGIVDKLSDLDKSSGVIKDPNQQGFASRNMLRPMMGLTGAAIGAPVGGMLDEEDPERGALRGAIGGGMLGYSGSKAIPGMNRGGNARQIGAEIAHDLVSTRNAGLLSGWSQVKKPLADLSGMLGYAYEHPESTRPILREMGDLKTNARNYMDALRNPDMARQATGDFAGHTGGEGPLGVVGRPFGAAQYASQRILERAGVPTDSALDQLQVGKSVMPGVEGWIKAQSNPAIRATMPFARISANLFGRGLQRTPGLNSLLEHMGALSPSEASLARRNMGGAASMALGGLFGAVDSNRADDGDPTSGTVKGLRRAAAGSYGLPFTIGETLAGMSPKEIYYMLPSFMQGSKIMEAFNNQPTLGRTIGKIGANFIDNAVPQMFQNKEDKGTAR